MAAKIPVTVITGFLGSGKTTLMRHLLQNHEGRRLAVIVNEFGELGIDGDLLKDCGADCPDRNVLELTNGCLCCTVQEEFLPTMQQLLARRDEIDAILIETSGLALPKPLVQAFRWPEIRNAATVDGVLAVVDCAAVASGTFASDVEAVQAEREADPNLDHETPLEELFEDQLACADMVILNKTDLVNETDLAQVETQVRTEIPRPVKIVRSQHGLLPPSILLGFNAAVEDNLDRRPSHHDTEEEHDHDDEIEAVQFMSDRPCNPRALEKALHDLMDRYELYRVKGFVWSEGKPMRLVMQGVGKRIDSFYDRPWHNDELRQTRLVLIGKELNEDAIATRLRKAIAH
ncbi:MAG: cobalamin biosynthesis protein CobW [Cyanobacteria bacterium J06642_2]